MATYAPITIKEAFFGGNRFPRITKDTIISVTARVTQILLRNKYKISFELSDITGKINTVFWLDENVCTQTIAVNDYVKVFGTMETKEHDKIQGTLKKELLAFKIIPITEIDAITCHYLQCIHKKNMDPYFCEKVIFNHIKKAEFDLEGEKGIPKANMYDDSELQKIMSKLEIENAINTLWQSGYIYSTTDEDYFRDTTAFDEFYSVIKS